MTKEEIAFVVVCAAAGFAGSAVGSLIIHWLVKRSRRTFWLGEIGDDDTPTFKQPLDTYPAAQVYKNTPKN